MIYQFVENLAIWLDLWTLTFGKQAGFPIGPATSEQLCAEGSLPQPRWMDRRFNHGGWGGGRGGSPNKPLLSPYNMALFRAYLGSPPSPPSPHDSTVTLGS